MAFGARLAQLGTFEVVAALRRARLALILRVAADQTGPELSARGGATITESGWRSVCNPATDDQAVTAASDSLLHGYCASAQLRLHRNQDHGNSCLKRRFNATGHERTTIAMQARVGLLQGSRNGRLTAPHRGSFCSMKT